MKTRIAIVLGSILLLSTPLAATGQEPSAETAGERALVAELCAATAVDETELDACTAAVEAILTEAFIEEPDQATGLLDQARSLVDDTFSNIEDALARAGEVDVQALVDEALADIGDIDVEGAIAEAQSAIDEAVASVGEIGHEIDVQAVIDEAVAEALTAVDEVDLQARVDEALAEAAVAVDGFDLDLDVEGAIDEAIVALEDSVGTARGVVAAAQSWARGNVDVVCRGSSVSLGTTVGVAVFVMTGVEWLGLQAFWATERFTNGLCGDIVE